MVVLGLWDGHDSGAALFADGRLLAAVNEERLTRRKLEIAFPRQSIAECLALAGLQPAAVDVVAISTRDPAKTLGRLAPAFKESYYQVRRRKTPPGRFTAFKRRGKYWITELGPGVLSTRLSEWSLRRELERDGLGRAALRLVDHHACHAAAAARTSGWPSCAVVTIDGLGDGASATVSSYIDQRLERVATSDARESLGIFFEHVTTLLNMRELEDEGKVMALADYAAPVPDADNPLLALFDVRDGVIHTRLSAQAMNGHLREVLWRYPNEQFAYMAQRTVEEVSMRLVRDAIRLTGQRRVALAGGVVSNVKANRRIRLMPEVEDVFVFPHMGDGGLALGAALIADPSASLPLRGASADLGFGRSFDDAAIERALGAEGVAAARPADLAGAVADLIAAGSIVLWFQGGMEYGPRALGHRSVLARPDRVDLRDRLNLVLKQRVWYQPFCPSMLESEASRVLADYSGPPNAHMTMAYLVAPEARGALAGVTSVDGSCRPQMVADAADTPFAALLRAVKARTGLGVVLNTSFNIHGEPLVCTPAEAVDVFRRTGADALAIGGFLVKARVPRPNAQGADSQGANSQGANSQGTNAQHEVAAKR